MEKQFKLIGKSYQMRSIHVTDGAGGFVQKQIRLGVNYILTESELEASPHVLTQAGKKVLKIVEIPESSTSASEKSKSVRKRRKKSG